MPANSYGIITEGAYDEAAYTTLIRRLSSPNVSIKTRACEGRPNLLRKFPGLLRTFEYAVDNSPVDIAIVICDADGTDPDQLEIDLRARTRTHTYRFPNDVRFHAVRNAMEAWLLADVSAINEAVTKRQGRRIRRSHENPESLLDPTQWLRTLLDEHRATYTSALCRDIAEKINFDLLAERCPRFRVFRELLNP
jgi:hypothetical protein